MTRLIPFGILVFLSVLGLGISLAKHGESQPAYNFWSSLFAFLVSWALIVWMVWL